MPETLVSSPPTQFFKNYISLYSSLAKDSSKQIDRITNFQKLQVVDFMHCLDVRQRASNTGNVAPLGGNAQRLEEVTC